MSKHFRHKGVILGVLGLFLFALINAGVHQINNPIETPEDCLLSSQHLHQNPETHQCELCDFQLTGFLTLASPLPSLNPIEDGYLEAGVAIISESHLYHPYLRGPPVTDQV